LGKRSRTESEDEDDGGDDTGLTELKRSRYRDGGLEDFLSDICHQWDPDGRMTEGKLDALLSYYEVAKRSSELRLMKLFGRIPRPVAEEMRCTVSPPEEVERVGGPVVGSTCAATCGALTMSSVAFDASWMDGASALDFCSLQFDEGPGEDWDRELAEHDVFAEICA
jgi:hypothetical protein